MVELASLGTLLVQNAVATVATTYWITWTNLVLAVTFCKVKKKRQLQI